MGIGGFLASRRRNGIITIVTNAIKLHHAFGVRDPEVQSEESREFSVLLVSVKMPAEQLRRA